MPEFPIKKEPNVLEEVERIMLKKQSGTGGFLALGSLRREQSLRMWQYTSRLRASQPDLWREIIARARALPQAEFRDEVADMKREIDTLRIGMATMNRELSSYRETIDELCKTVYESPSKKRIISTRVDELCKGYIDTIKSIDVVRQILLVEDKDVTTIWTIIDAVPFDSSLRTPIYDAQGKIFSVLEEDIALDFYVLNLSELPEKQKLESITPPSAKLIWER